MRLELAEAVVNQNARLILHRDYSGRGMFGKTTAAVSGSLIAFIGAVADAVLASTDGDDVVPFASIDFQNLRYDSLGNDTIFY